LDGSASVVPIGSGVRENAMKSANPTSGPERNRGGALHYLQEHIAVLLLAAFVLASAVALWQLSRSAPDLYEALVNFAVLAYALGLLALAVLIRRMRRTQAQLQDA